MFYAGRKQATAKFSFSFWAWISLLGIQLQERSNTFNKVRIIAIEKPGIHFLSDVSPAVAVIASWGPYGPPNIGTNLLLKNNVHNYFSLLRMRISLSVHSCPQVMYWNEF